MVINDLPLSVSLLHVMNAITWAADRVVQHREHPAVAGHALRGAVRVEATACPDPESIRLMRVDENGLIGTLGSAFGLPVALLLLTPVALYPLLLISRSLSAAPAREV